jgi:hypothetical protein
MSGGGKEDRCPPLVDQAVVGIVRDALDITTPLLRVMV